MSTHSSNSDYVADSLASGMMAIVIVLLVILIYLLIRAVNLIVRVLAKYPHIKMLWILLGTSVGFSVLYALFQRVSIIEEVFATLAGMSWLLLLLACKFVEVAYDPLFQPDKVSTVQRVLHRPWWEGDQTA